MEKEFVPYELALRMKALGFDDTCLAFHSKIYGLLTSAPTKNVNEIAGECLAPLYQQAFRWFREKYEVLHIISSNSFMVELTINGGFIRESSTLKQNKSFTTYEEAELACLEKLIEIVEPKSE